jgi:hypothetical protein
MKSPLVPLVLALLLLPLSLSAQTGTWTAVASTGAIDEASLAAYSTNGTFLQHLGASVTNVVARYNVTNTFGGGLTDVPPWNTLELGYFDNAVGSSVTAVLFRVDPCTGARVTLCSIVSTDATTATCQKCNFTQQVNFAAFLYYVEVTVQRNAGNLTPSARTLRIF